MRDPGTRADLSVGGDKVPAVDLDTFWDIIETTQAGSGPELPLDRALAQVLASRGRQDILDFQKRFYELHAALWRHDLWAAAYLIEGGCSDDGFHYFRSGLIGQGREWYEKATADPDCLADHPAINAEPDSFLGRPLSYETIEYAAIRAFEAVCGDREDFYEALGSWPRGPEHDGQDPAREDFDFDFDDSKEMRRRLPRLFAACVAGRGWPSAD